MVLVLYALAHSNTVEASSDTSNRTEPFLMSYQLCLVSKCLLWSKKRLIHIDTSFSDVTLCLCCRCPPQVKVQCQKGIPASLKAKCWPLLCGASDRMKQNENLYKARKLNTPTVVNAFISAATTSDGGLQQIREPATALLQNKQCDDWQKKLLDSSIRRCVGTTLTSSVHYLCHWSNKYDRKLVPAPQKWGILRVNSLISL